MESFEVYSHTNKGYVVSDCRLSIQVQIEIFKTVYVSL